MFKPASMSDLSEEEIANFHRDKDAMAQTMANMILEKASSPGLSFYVALNNGLVACCEECVGSTNYLIANEYFPLVLLKVGKNYSYEFIEAHSRCLEMDNVWDRIVALNFIRSLWMFEKESAIYLAKKLFRIVDYDMYPELVEECLKNKLEFEELSNILSAATAIHNAVCFGDEEAC